MNGPVTLYSFNGPSYNRLEGCIGKIYNRFYGGVNGNVDINLVEDSYIFDDILQ